MVILPHFLREILLQEAKGKGIWPLSSCNILSSGLSVNYNI